MDAAPHDQSNHPRLIDIDPLLLSNLELEVMLNIPYESLPRPRLLQLALLTGRHFAETGRYPGWGARIDILRDVNGRITGAVYRFEGCVCGSCPAKMYGQHDGFTGCSFPVQMRRY